MPSRHGVTVSLCMIVRNEEHNLADCLRPVAPLFDEIIIVDTGSVDRTKEIASEFASKVIDFPWCDNFSSARNESIRHATSDWIFWLDADDRVSEAELPRLKMLLEQLDQRPQVFMMNTVCRSQFESDGVRYISHPRLFRRDPAIQWSGRVHEQLRPQPEELGHEIITLDLVIEHLGYTNDAQQLKKMQRDIRLLRMDYAVDPEDVSTLFHLALAYARVENRAESQKYLQLIVQKNLPTQDWQRRLYELLAEFELKNGDLNLALEHNTQGLMKFSHDIPLLFQRAQIFYEANLYDECLTLLRSIENNNQPILYHGGSQGEIRERRVPWLIAETLKQQGDYTTAEAVMLKHLQDHPQDIHGLWSLSSIYLLTGRRALMAEVRERMLSLPQGNVFALISLIQDKLQHDELTGVSEHIDELIQIVPNMPLPRMLRVQYLCRIDAPIDAYLSACRDVLRVYPNHPEIQSEIAHWEQVQQTINLLATGELYQPILVGTVQ